MSTSTSGTFPNASPTDKSAVYADLIRRYEFVRDNGHLDFIDKAETCINFTVGNQWKAADKEVLSKQRRPALTINKILPTINSLLGEHLKHRAEISFRPRGESNEDLSEVLSKLFDHINYNNNFSTLESEVFREGVITSRGFYDVRLDFDDSMEGEIRITSLNPKNVILDPEAEEYDPDTWSEVFVTKWVTYNDLAILYGKKTAERVYKSSLDQIADGALAYDYIQEAMDGFGQYYLSSTKFQTNTYGTSKIHKAIRLIERQYKEIQNREFFVDPQTGDMRAVPDSWDKQQIAEVQQILGYDIAKKQVERIRWVVVAAGEVLHNEWSPYNHFTVVPYFPILLHGHTVGVVENLLDPQEMLNKVSSQELHVVNTTANSGWKVKHGTLMNMSIEELEQRGAETGLVIETRDLADIDKITPNPVPTGLDRLSYKAEEHIKTISNVTDTQLGQDREDVSSKAIGMKQARGSVNYAKLIDNLNYTRKLLARNMLSIVQEYYSEPRVFRVVSEPMTNKTEEISINQEDPEDPTARIFNDLTLGEYDVIVVSQPAREVQEDNEFEEAVRLRELGVQIPDSTLIEHSRLRRKGEILKQMGLDKESPEARRQAEMQAQAQQLEIEKLKMENEKLRAESALKMASAKEKIAQATAVTDDPGTRQMREKAMLDAQMMRAKMDHEKGLAQEKNSLTAMIEDNKGNEDADAGAKAKAKVKEKK